MSKILYSSIDEQGHQKNGFIEAASNHEALDALTSMGHSDVQFYADGSLALESDRDLFSPFNDRSARFQIEIRYNLDFTTILLQSLMNNWIYLLMGILLLFVGLYLSSGTTMTSGIALLIFVPVITAWKHRVTLRYDKLLSNFAVGNWHAVLQDIAYMRNHQAGTEMKLDFDIREATAQYKLSGDTEAVEALEDWKQVLDAESPGYYEMRMASVQHGLDHPEKFVELMREAYSKSSNSPIIVTDLALGEARLGDVDRAAELFKILPTEQLPIEGEAFVSWIAGLIAYRSGRSGAVAFDLALRTLAQFGGSPALWPSIAVCVGDWAVHASDQEWVDCEIAEKLRAVWPIFIVHSEEDTVKRVSERLGGEPQGQ